MECPMEQKNAAELSRELTREDRNEGVSAAVAAPAMAVPDDSIAAGGSSNGGSIEYSTAGVTWQELIERLLSIFQADKVNIEEVEALLSSYASDPADWKKYAKFDKYKYTRNLAHEGNGKFNLMLLCWTPGNQSCIHDHSNAHCFVKVLAGGLKETRYYWPHEKTSSEGEMVKKEEYWIKADEVTYMSDELGLHRVENTSHSDNAVSLHLYSPPFQACKVFDERTGNVMQAPMTFWSKFGSKVNRTKAYKSCDCAFTID